MLVRGGGEVAILIPLSSPSPQGLPARALLAQQDQTCPSPLRLKTGVPHSC